MAESSPVKPPPLPKIPVIQIAGRGKRTLCALLDFTVILLVSSFLVAKIFWPTMYPSAWPELVEWQQEANTQIEHWQSTPDAPYPTYPDPPLAAQEGVAFAQVFTGMVVWFYFFFSEVFTRGSSLGKSVFGLRVMSMRHAGPPTPLECGVRASIKASCFIMPIILLPINLLVMLLHRQRQALHDLTASTLVVAMPMVLVQKKPVKRDD
ncbi:RDD family protein [Cerasicoccus fimbriatus]|uniref:RDD family protein n=1 Tax=Cerasicoccus fimbriatus TaxID=3014554 RepID=UPI0022B5A7B7|nr:RDD family protein [Cerasicoccus sp. TK19100]